MCYVIEERETEYQVVFLVDVSNSMEGKMLTMVNTTIPIIFHEMIRYGKKESIKYMIRMIKYSDEAEYLIGNSETGVEVNDIVWRNFLVERNGSNVCKAISKAKEIIVNHIPKPSNYGVPYLYIILISDGKYTNSKQEYEAAIKEITNLRKVGPFDIVKRAALVIDDAELEELTSFVTDGGGFSKNGPLLIDMDCADDLPSIFEVTDDDVVWYDEDDEDDDSDNKGLF